MSLPRPSVLPLAVLLGSCGSGTIGVVSGSSSGGGGSTPTLTALQVLTPRVSPAILRLEASAGVQAELFLSVRGAPEVPMTGLTSPAVSGNRAQLDPGVNDISWAFSGALGTGFVDDVTIVARFSGGPIIGGGVLRTSVGNNPPEVLSVEPVTDAAGQASGTVEVALLVSDSSSDVVSIQVEWRRLSDDPDDWKPASVGGIPAGVETSASGDVFSFFWKTDEDGLGAADEEFLLRVTADDGTLDGGTQVGIGRGTSPVFRVDNNAAPLTVVDEAGLILQLDGRRGIPVSFAAIDAESDDLRVLLQWRVAGGEFPDLGGRSPEQLIALLEEPALEEERRGLQIGRQFPVHARGRVGSLLAPLPADQVRLPELAGSAAGALAAPGLGGRTLEILRPAEPVAVRWPGADALPGVAAVALTGRLALVLVEDPAGWRVLEVDLTDGSRQSFASGPGDARVMGTDPARRHLFVGTGTGVFRLDLSSGVQTGFVPHAFLDGPRGLAALGQDVVLLTGDDALRRIDLAAGSPRPDAVLVDGLRTPWGIVQDPHRPNTIYLAEQGADRVSSLDLQRLAFVEVPAEVRPADVPALGSSPFPGPRALALERGGGRLLVLTQVDALQSHTERGGGPFGSRCSLRGLDLGAAPPFAFEITAELPDAAAGLATGPEGLRIVSSSTTLALGGGVAQTRTIVEQHTPGEESGPLPYDPSRQVVTVEEGFAPALEHGAPWRLSAADDSFARSSPSGERNTYVWDSSEADERVVQVRIVPLDTDVGTTTLVSGSKVLGDPFVPGSLAGAQPGGRSITPADLDGDGDLDLVTAGDSLWLHFQGSPGQFAETVSLGSAEFVYSVVAADLDGDGDLDLARATNAKGIPVRSTFEVFFQGGPGQFGQPVVLADSLSQRDSLTAADLDGDGDLDLVATNTDSAAPLSPGSLQVFFQESPGSFPGAGVELSDPSMVSPISVVAADLNGDGLLDLASANRGSSAITIFLQQSPGRFGPAMAQGYPVTSGATSVVAADLDGDGDLDLAVAHGSDHLTLLFQEGPGQFARTAVVTGPSGACLVSLLAADLDADGDLDLAAACDVDGNDLTLFYQESPGQFARRAVTLSDPAEALTSVAAADLDADGHLDLLTTGSRPKAFLHAGPGRFAGDVLVLDDPAASFNTVGAADLDGDGDLDLVTGPGPALFFQESPGRFAQDAVVPDPATTLVGPFAADLDGDGDLDLVAATLANDLTILFQESPGQFTGRMNLSDSVASVPSAPIAADLDGDGDLDIASTSFVADSQSSRLVVFFQEGPGQFAEEPFVLEGPSSAVAGAPVAADLDADGNLDLVMARLFFDGSSQLVIHFQEQPGEFGQAVALPEPALRFLSVVAADLDGDGDMDLLAPNASSSSGNVLAVFTQEGPGRFASEALVLSHPGARGPYAACAVDLDGDGDLDLVATDRQSSHPLVFLQQSPGRFAVDALVLDNLTVVGPRSVIDADLDGDGEPDLVTTNGLQNLSILFGGH